MTNSQEPTIPFPRGPNDSASLLRRSSMPASFHPSSNSPAAVHREMQIPINPKRSQSSTQHNSDSRLSHFLSMVEASNPQAVGGKRAPLRIEDAVDLGDDDAFSSSPVLTGSSWGSSGWTGPERRAATTPSTPLTTPPQSRRPSLLSALTSRPNVSDLSMTPAMERIDSKGKKHYNPSRDPRLLGIF